MKTTTQDSKQSHFQTLLLGSPLKRSFVTAISLVTAFSWASIASADTVLVFDAEGTTEWVCPAGVTSIKVECWGGGGAGGTGTKTGSTANNTSQNGGGGGGGAYAARFAVPVTPGESYSITIPPAAVSGTDGIFRFDVVNGGTVTFMGEDGVTVSAGGGAGGENSYVNVNATSGRAGGAGGTAIEGDSGAIFSGGNGSSGNTGGTNVSGSGGGGAGNANPGGDGNTTLSTTTPGAGGVIGGGAGGAGREGGNSNEGPGADGVSPGGGGGGGKNQGGGTQLGGSGGLGQISLTIPTEPIVKADTADDLNLGSSWLGGIVPGSTDTAKWDDTVTGASSTVLGGDQVWSGIEIVDPAGPVTISGPGNTLTLGAAAIDIDLSAATQDLTVNSGLILDGPSVWTVASSRTLTLGGEISGQGPVSINGDGTTVLSGANTYAESTTIESGVLQLGASEVIPDGVGVGDLLVNGILDLNGFSEGVNALSGSGVIDTLSGGTSVLTAGNNDQTSTFNGTLQNTAGTLSFAKVGSGTLTLEGENTYSGSTTVSGGTLRLGTLSALGNTSGLTIGGGAELVPNLGGVTIDAPIILSTSGAPSAIFAPNGGAGVLTLGGTISGEGDLELYQATGGNALGEIVLGSQNTYAGNTLLDTAGGGSSGSRLSVILGIDDALPTSTVLTLDGGTGAGSGRLLQLDLNGHDQTLAGLENVFRTRRNQFITNSGEPATLTVNNDADHNFTGTSSFSFSGSARIARTRITGQIALTKGGTGTLTLGTDPNYSGDTTINDGTLSLGANNPSNDSSRVLIAGGAFLDLNFAGTDTVDQLFIDGVQMAAGEYGNSGATLPVIARPEITGPGTLTVTSGTGAGYVSWAAANAGGQTPDLDFDGDGIENGIEFFFNAPAGFTVLPTLDDSNTITWPNGGNIPASEYGPAGLFVVQVSSDLVNWTDVEAVDLASNTDTGLSFNLTGGSPRFVRLKVTPN